MQQSCCLLFRFEMDQYLEIAKSTLKQWLPKNEKELEWWIKFRKPEEILKKHATYLYCEVILYIIGFLTLYHAMQSGGRYRWLWFAAIAHGLTVESVSYFVPDIDNFWHAQSMVMLLGQRLPLHIIFLYPVFIYTAVVAVSHMNLRWWAEPFAVGLTVVLIDIPFDIMGIKLLWWTWHDDDPNIYDRHYYVPWTSYYFHAAFSSSFAFLFLSLPNILCSSGLKFRSSGFFVELLILIATGLFSMPLGILQFIPVYHPLHDSLAIHSEVCVLLLLSVFSFIVWSADRTPLESARQPRSNLFKVNSLVLGVLLHYGFYIYLVLAAKPQEIVSVGYHQTVGACDVPVKVLTPLGHLLKKNKYLCVDHYYEEYFDFSCVKTLPSSNVGWYTICGTPYKNHEEYILVVSAFCAFGLFWFWQLLCRSGNQPRTSKPTPRVKQHWD